MTAAESGFGLNQQVMPSTNQRLPNSQHQRFNTAPNEHQSPERRAENDTPSGMTGEHPGLRHQHRADSVDSATESGAHTWHPSPHDHTVDGGAHPFGKEAGLVSDKLTLHQEDQVNRVSKGTGRNLAVEPLGYTINLENWDYC